MNQFRQQIQKSCVAIFVIVVIFLGSFSQIAAASTGHLCLGHNSETVQSHEDHAVKGKNSDKHKISGHNHSKNKSANHGCCAAHCCAMQAIDKADYETPSYYPLKESPLFVYESAHSSDLIFGILRPPRLIV